MQSWLMQGHGTTIPPYMSDVREPASDHGCDPLSVTVTHCPTDRDAELATCSSKMQSRGHN